MTLLSKLLFVVLFTSLMFGCVSSRYYRPRQINVNGEFIHKTTSTLFPVNLEKYTRESITIFNKDSTNVGVNYKLNDANQDLKISIYVYPATNGVEHRLRDEYLNCLQSIAIASNRMVKTTHRHVRVSKDGYKVLGLSSSISDNNFNSVLELFECGKYFLKYRLTSSKIDTTVLKSITNKLADKFSPIDIVKKQPLLQGVDIHISPAITSDSICLVAIFKATKAKIDWVYSNVDSLERCSGFPSLYFEEQKASIDSMLNYWENEKHNNSRFDIFFDDLVKIRKSGFLNEFICDQYLNTLLVPDKIKLDRNNYEIWKKKTNPTVNLVGEYYYLLSYGKSFEEEEKKSKQN